VDLVVEDDPDPEDLATLETRLADATAAATGHPRSGERPLAVLARADDGSLVGGISGWTWGGTCELLHLWVDVAGRGVGLGTALLDAAEAEATRRGCHQVVLFTHAVHAGPGEQRYPRRGYELVGRVDDYPTGDAALWYRKPLGPDAATSSPST
jgi:GNAT superfamily N-acetyltransferase